jgi:hypothetical protein
MIWSTLLPLLTSVGSHLFSRVGGGASSPQEAAEPYINRSSQEMIGLLRPYLERMEREHLEDRPRAFSEHAEDRQRIASDRMSQYEAYRRMLGMYENMPQAPESRYQPIYNQMAENPGQHMQGLMQGYEPSKQYQTKSKEMLGAMRNSAAAGGMLGTPYSQRQQADVVRDLLNSDMGEYLEHMSNTQGRGMAGEEERVGRLGQDMYRRRGGIERALTGMAGNPQATPPWGVSAGGESLAPGLAQSLGTNFNQIGSLAFQGQRERNLNRSYDRANRASLFQSLMPNLFGTGAGGNLGGLFGSIFGG